MSMSPRVDVAYREQRQAKVTDLGKQAVQRRLVGDRPGDHGHAAAGFARQLQPVEPGRPALVEDALDVDFVAHRSFTPSGVRTGPAWRSVLVPVPVSGDVHPSSSLVLVVLPAG